MSVSPLRHAWMMQMLHAPLRPHPVMASRQQQIACDKVGLVRVLKRIARCGDVKNIQSFQLNNKHIA